MDDISVVPTDVLADAGPDKNIFLGDSALIGKPQEVGINCIWTTGTTTLGSGTGIWVKPPTTTTYVVHQTICGNTKTDTVTVTVDYVGIKENNFSTLIFSINPNPNNGVFKGEFSNFIAGHEYKISVKDMLGRELRSISLNSKTATIDISELDNGIYLIELKDRFNRITQKRVILSK